MDLLAECPETEMVNFNRESIVLIFEMKNISLDHGSPL